MGVLRDITIADTDEEAHAIWHESGYFCGREWFLPSGKGGSRKDSLDLLARAKEHGWRYVEKPQELAGVTKGPLLGLFALGDMAFALDPSD